MKKLLASYWSDGIFLVAASLIANVCNLIYNAYLVKTSVITIEEFGVISVIGSLLTILQIPLSAYSRGIVHETAYYLGRYKTKPIQLWRKLRQSSIKVSILIVLLWIILIPFLSVFFNVHSYLPFVLLTPLWLIAIPSSIDSGFLTGILAFKVTAGILVSEVLIKLLLTITFIELGYVKLFYLSIPISSIIAFYLGYYFIRKQYKSIVNEKKIYKRSISTGFVLSSFFSKISMIVFLNVDVLLAKHFLNPTEAGMYAFLSFVGKIVYFAGVLFIQFINPLISKRIGERKNHKDVMLPIVVASLSLTCITWVLFGMFSQITLQFLDKNNLLLQISTYIPMYTFAMGCLAISTGVISYYQAKHRYDLSLVSFLCSIFMIIGIYLWHDTYGQIAVVVSVSGIFLSVISLLAFVFDSYSFVFKRNIKDAKEAFSKTTKQRSEQPSLLILNWRDIRHVWAGGSEVYLHEIARGFVKKGYRVTIFCGNDNKNKRDEMIDGVEIIRRGGFFTVYLWAAVYYLFKFRAQFDMILDCENGIPFFSPLYSRIPVVLVIHHVHQKVFQKHLPFPFSEIAMVLERKLMPIVYKKSQIVTVSNSSKREIIKYKFADEKRIFVIEPGIDQLDIVKKESKYPSVLYLGRLKSYKQVDVLIQAFLEVANKIPKSHLYIAGTGEEDRNLKRLVNRLQLSNHVTFLGRVSEEEKVRLYSTCWVSVQPSSIEGWGITVIEANNLGTPVIGSKVNGLKDSIKHNVTGVLVPPGNSKRFSHAIIDLLTDHKKRLVYSKASLKWSKDFSWERNVETIEKIFDLSKENHEAGRVKRIAVRTQGAFYER